MWRRVIAPAPTNKLPAVPLTDKGELVARMWSKKEAALTGYPDEAKASYVKASGVNVGVVDFLTEDPPPIDALYVCEQRSPTNYVVTKAAPVDLCTAHDFDGWPSPNGALASPLKIAMAVEDATAVKG